MNETLKHLPREVDALTSSSAGQDYSEADTKVTRSSAGQFDIIFLLLLLNICFGL